MDKLLQIVDALDEKLHKLLQAQQALKVSNEQLKLQNEQLQQQIANKQEALDLLEQQYESLKIANAIVGSKEDRHITKLKINTLIREIDKCIVQLSD